MRASTGSKDKQEEYLKKLRTIDQYVAKTTSNHQPGFSIDDLFRLLATKALPDPPQQLTPFTQKIVLFEDRQIRRFCIKELTADKGKQFILNLSSHAPIRVSIAINEAKPKFYSLRGTKAIVIPELSWKNLLVSIEMEKAGFFSSVKLHLDVITMEHKNPKKGNVNLRPNIDNQLEAYLREKRGKTAQILKSRSQARLRESVSRRRIVTTGSLSGPNSIKKAEMVRTKSQLFKFEKKKEFYIRHFERMSPQKTKQVQEGQVDYNYKKKMQIANLAKLVLTVKLALHVRDQSIKIHREKLRKIKLNFLCLDFVKIIKNKFKLKMTEKARLRAVNLHYIHSMPSILYQGSIKNAKKILLQGLMPYMQFRGLQELTANSEEYLSNLKKIQWFFRRKRRAFKDRIGIIVDRLCVIYHLELLSKKREEVIENYYKQCLQESVFNYYANKSRLLEMIREEAL